MKQEPTEQATPVGGPLSTKEPWDIVADAYTGDSQPWAEYFASEALQLASLPSSPTIVDVATGPGSLALLAAKEGWDKVANGVLNHLHETIGDGPVEELYTMYLGVGTK
jgi:hypothetical protein